MGRIIFIPRIFLVTMLTCLAFSSVTYMACKEDKCKDVNCQNGATCSAGICNCPTNYSGVHCETAGPCAGINCLNGGTCNNGNCTCPTGYEGTYCETEIRTKFEKIWAASDTNVFNNNPVTTYQAVITGGTDISQVAINGIFNGFFAHNVTGIVKGDTIIVNIQQPDAGNNNYSISGSAFLLNDTLYWHYTIVTTGTVNYKGIWR